MESELLTQFGVAGLIFAAFMFLLKWVLKQQERILDNANEERKSWQVVISTMKDAIHKQSEQDQVFINGVQEAHKFQREEHKEMIGILKSINGKEEKQ